MKRTLYSCILTVVLCGLALAQKPAPPGPAKPAAAPVITETTAYLLPIEMQKQFRDAQLEWDELEIDNQRMLVKAEQNKARQAALTDGMRKIAYQFAVDKKIDLEVNQLDSKELKFLPKKKVK